MNGPLFFVEPGEISGDRVELRGDQAHHLAVVLRAVAGTAVTVSDGAGGLYSATVLRAEAERAGALVQLALGERQAAPVALPRLTVVHALPKGRKLDGVVQRLSEIGVDRVVPVHSENSQVELRGERADRAVRRWRAVALAAAKQSRRPRLLEVAPVGNWADAFVAALGAGAGGVVFWESSTVALSTVAGTLRGTDDVVIGIGPEGGLTAAEAEGTGLPAVSLGPTVLRTETAALVGAVAIGVHLGRLG